MKIATFSIGISNILIAISQIPFLGLTLWGGVTYLLYFHILTLLAFLASGILILKNIQLGWILSLSVLLFYIAASLYVIVTLFPRDGMSLFMPNSAFYVFYPPNNLILVLILFVIQLSINIRLNLKAA